MWNCRAGRTDADDAARSRSRSRRTNGVLETYIRSRESKAIPTTVENPSAHSLICPLGVTFQTFDTFAPIGNVSKLPMKKLPCKAMAVGPYTGDSHCAYLSHLTGRRSIDGRRGTAVESDVCGARIGDQRRRRRRLHRHDTRCAAEPPAENRGIKRLARRHPGASTGVALDIGKSVLFRVIRDLFDPRPSVKPGP